MSNITTIKKTAADRIVLKISTSKGHRGKVTNVASSWANLIDKLSKPLIDNITWKQYLKLPVMEQVKKKNQGYFVGGQFKDGLRKIVNITKRSMLTLDCDRLTMEQFEEFFDPCLSLMGAFEYFAYTTRSHKADSPRLRVVIPLALEIDTEEFQAASRILAHMLDERMELVDPVSFRPAQVMYYPSRCSDGEFKCFHHEGRLLNAQDDILAPFGDWTNWHLLPRGERDSARATGGAKAEHPSQKKGFVGAYCRARDVFDQLFSMTTLYEPVEEGPTPTRWSWLGGKSRDGVVVYPEDGRIQFYQSTDPCGDKNLISFDVERIHKFGHLDKAEDEHGDVAPNEMPSYKAFVAELQTSDEYADVRKEHAAMQFDVDAMADDAGFQDGLDEEDEPETHVVGAIVDEVTSVAPKPAAKAQAEPEPEIDILDLLDMTEKGAVKKTIYNLDVILRHDTRFKGAFRFNEFLSKPVMTRPISSKSLRKTTGRIKSNGNGDDITDVQRNIVQTIISTPNRDERKGWGVDFPLTAIASQIEGISTELRFHPIKRYLQGVKWDGVSRIGTMLADYWNTARDHYHSEVGLKMMVAGVARIFEPGCKFDYMVIFEGPEGLRKSTAVAILGIEPDWFGNMMADLSKPERVIESISGRWIVEWGELASMNRADVNTVKDLVTAGKLTGRLAYRRDQATFPYQCLFIGTTNDKEYLKSTTGNRRFLPVRIGTNTHINTDGLLAVRDQLWAEAYQYYLWMAGQSARIGRDIDLSLDAAASATAKLIVAERLVTTADSIYAGYIAEWLDTDTTEAAAMGHLDVSADDDVGDEELSKSLPNRICVASIAHYVLGIDRKKLTQNESRMIAAILDRLTAFNRVGERRFKGFGMQLTWVRDDL